MPLLRCRVGWVGVGGVWRGWRGGGGGGGSAGDVFVGISLLCSRSLGSSYLGSPYGDIQQAGLYNNPV